MPPEPQTASIPSAQPARRAIQIGCGGFKLSQNSRNRRDETKRAIYVDGFAGERKCIFSSPAEGSFAPAECRFAATLIRTASESNARRLTAKARAI
jgi:hypothetical protein